MYKPVWSVDSFREKIKIKIFSEREKGKGERPNTAQHSFSVISLTFFIHFLA
ncbi:unnamed protein product [Meloidogyne enterolobii]|uniref:Uncharacterized protein n=1 Tax=Meloidogyne enterolobii TaxID=390850 RepID=A0ACB0ZLE0_MELEN